MSPSLSTTDHSRDVAGLTYVYPVLSRRAGGISIGINVNTNNACNWRCIYCQVPDLIRGNAPDVNFELLETELTWFLEQIRNGQFYQQYSIEPEQQIIKDLAISGNGEPTSIKQFERLVQVVAKVTSAQGFLPGLKLVLITNGSLIHQTGVQKGLKLLNSLGGELWFKLDSATPEGREAINHTPQSQSQLLKNLNLAMTLCKTKLQTCLVNFDGAGWSSREQNAYLELLAGLKHFATLPEIMLYTLARPSLQPEASKLAPLPIETLDAFANLIRKTGFSVSVNV